MASTKQLFDARLALFDMHAFVRRHLPWLMVALTGVLLFRFSTEIGQRFESKDWDIAAFYSALFSWSSIQGAFLFGVYAFVLGRSEPFIRAVAKTEAFEQTRDYVRRTVYLALGLTVLCMPMLGSVDVQDSQAG